MRQVPDWHTYFMSIAQVVATRSKDSHTQVGSVIVDKDNHIIGTGYNGFKAGEIETPELWERPIKYTKVQHSEWNALQHCTRDPYRATLYTTMFPCIACAKELADIPISKIYYLDDKYWSQEAADLFSACGITTVKL